MWIVVFRRMNVDILCYLSFSLTLTVDIKNVVHSDAYRSLVDCIPGGGLPNPTPGCRSPWMQTPSKGRPLCHVTSDACWEANFPCEQTNMSKNITFLQLRQRAGINKFGEVCIPWVYSMRHTFVYVSWVVFEQSAPPSLDVPSDIDEVLPTIANWKQRW